MIKAIKNTLPIAESITRLLHPYAEVAVHDIKKNRIAAIYNSFSKRCVGDDSLLTAEEINALSDCIGPYEKLNWDGKKLKSVSSIIRDEKGVAVAMLCINLDISQFEKFNELLAHFIGQQPLSPPPAPLFKDDWQERINHYIHHYLRERHLILESLTRQEKQRLIEHLNEVGAFTAKNAALYIAQIIGVSRATIYNYLTNKE